MPDMLADQTSEAAVDRCHCAVAVQEWPWEDLQLRRVPAFDRQHRFPVHCPAQLVLCFET